MNKEHPSFKPCRDYKEGKCKRTKCRYKHRIIKEGNCVCFQCGKDFTDTTVMMSHIKSNHKRSVCKKFLKNKCDREEGTDEECWFRHEKMQIPHQPLMNHSISHKIPNLKYSNIFKTWRHQLQSRTKNL